MLVKLLARSPPTDYVIVVFTDWSDLFIERNGLKKHCFVMLMYPVYLMCRKVNFQVFTLTASDEYLKSAVFLVSCNDLLWMLTGTPTLQCVGVCDVSVIYIWVSGVCVGMRAQSLIGVQLFATPWTCSPPGFSLRENFPVHHWDSYTSTRHLPHQDQTHSRACPAFGKVALCSSGHPGKPNVSVP